MNRVLSLMVSLVLVGSMLFAGFAEQVNGTDTEPAFEVIQVGSTGSAVRELQQKLKALGYRIGQADGIFGSRTANGLRELQSAMGLEQTGIIGSQAELDEILNADKGDGVNMVWDGRFEFAGQYWKSWGNPTACGIVAINGQNWMHLISSGTRYEGLHQDISMRNGNNATPELIAGQSYTLSFTAFGTSESTDKTFRCGIHNRDLTESKNQEQYWTPHFILTEEPHDYVFTFTPEVDGTFNIMIGNGDDGVIEAWFTNIKIETGNVASEWSEAPALN